MSVTKWRFFRRHRLDGRGIVRNKMALFFLNLMEYPFRGGVGEWGSGRVFRVKIAKKTPKKAKISTIQPISNDLNVEGQPHMTSAHP